MMLRDRLMPLIEQFHRLSRESIEAIGRMRQMPSIQVERAEAMKLVLV